ncbi:MULTISPECIES: tellurite resistance TerB family protein [Cobetia]|uniref:Tellurite resistance TerB n=1 Tax=Cobetia crustatorum TaxID=553385 RepID=A0A558HLI8_9GAMM|nr:MULTISPECIES: TerB family tellurite resistance protein [Cobetia]TVU69993.1 Tellurite resistance TerB [Cobetia crustatorum]
MLNSIVSKARESFNSLKTEAKKYKSESFLNAAMAASAMIAVADGEISRDEKQKTIAFVRNHEALSVFDPSEVARKFKSYLDSLDPQNPDTDADLAEITALNDIGKVKKNDDQARMVVRLAIAIGGADGDFDEAEKAKASVIARELGLDPADFGL